MIFIKSVSALNPTLQECDIDSRACIAREAAQEQGMQEDTDSEDFPARLNRRAMICELLDFGYALRTHPEQWIQYLQNPQSSEDVSLGLVSRHAALLFTLWLADYCGVLSLVSDEPFLVLNGLHRTVRKYGVRVEASHLQQSDLLVVKQTWERLGRPSVDGLDTNLHEFFNSTVNLAGPGSARRLPPLVADLLHQFGFPVESQDCRHYTIVVDELLDNCCIAAAFQDDKDVPPRDKLGRLCPDLQPLFLARFRLRSRQPIMV